MISYMRSLPGRDIAERRRFVVLATTVSFVGIVVLWLLLGLLTRNRGVAPTPLPTLEAPASETPLPLESSEPASLDVFAPSLPPTPTADAPLFAPDSSGASSESPVASPNLAPTL